MSGKASHAVEARTVVDKVIVYNVGATVRRVAKGIELRAGENIVTFRNIPKSVKEDNVQIGSLGDQGNFVLKGVSFDTEVVPVAVTCRVKNDEEHEQNEEKVVELEDALEVVKTRLAWHKKWFEKITSATKKDGARDRDPDAWRAILQSYKEKLAQYLGTQRTIERDLDTVRQLVSAYKQRQVAPKSRVATVLNASVVSKEDQTVDMSIQYMETAAGWVPAYDVRVSGKDRTLTLDYHGVVHQTTAEVWDNVVVVLSSARPTLSGDAPELIPWRLSMWKAPRRNSRREMVRCSAPSGLLRRQAGRIDEEDDVVAPNVETAAVSEGAINVSYTIANTHSVGNVAGDTQRLSIGRVTLATTFQYVTVPKKQQKAYLRATVVNTSNFTFFKGKCALFFDNSFISASSLPRVAPTETFTLNMGVDESIHVKHKLVKKYRSGVGNVVSGKSDKTTFEYLIVVQNNKNFEVPVTILDQLPLSDATRLTVELLEPPYTEDTDSMTKDDEGILTFKRVVPAHVEWKLPLKFVVEHPSGDVLYGV